MFLCALFMCFIFEIQCIKQVAKLVALPPVIMGYDDIDNHEFIISDEENTPDEIKRHVVTNVFEKEVKNSPVTKITTSKILLSTLSPEKYKTSLTHKDTKMSPPGSSADSDSYDDSTLPAIKKKEELDKSPPSLEQDKTPQNELYVDSEETQKSDGIKSDDVIAKSELLSSTSRVTKEKEVIDKSPPSHEQDITSQKEHYIDSEETQKSDGIKSGNEIAKFEFLSSTLPITKEKEMMDNSPPSHEQDVTSQEEHHVDSEETQKVMVLSDDVIAKSDLLTSTLAITKEKEVIDKSPPSHEQDVTSQEQLHVDNKETQEDNNIKSDDVLANSELTTSTSPITKEKEKIVISPPSHEQDVTSQEELHVDNKKTQEGYDIKSDDDLANSELITSTSPMAKEKENVVISPPSHEQDITSQEELHVDNKKTQQGDDIKSDDDLANSELITSTSLIAKEKEKVVISPPSHEQGITSQDQVHVDKEGTLGDTKKEDKVQKEDLDDDEDHKNTLHSSVSTESEKPVPVARNYLVNGFI